MSTMVIRLITTQKVLKTYINKGVKQHYLGSNHTSFNYPQTMSKLVIYLSNPSKFISSIVLVYHTHKELLSTLKILYLCVTQRASWKTKQDTILCLGTRCDTSNPEGLFFFS